MNLVTRRTVLLGGVASAALLGPVARAFGQTKSLTDMGGLMSSAPAATIYTAREFVTLDPDRPSAKAIAVVGGRILAVGALDEVQKAVGDQPHRVDERFADKVVVQGFVAQHDHPVLAALTMSSEILSIEDWVLPTGTVPAVKDKQDFIDRLTKAVNARTDPTEPVLSWGYHPAFYGPLVKSELDAISADRPIFVWGRSCHEMFMNSGALKAGGVTQEVVDGFAESARKQSNFEEGHFWEQGIFAVLPYIAAFAASPERLKAGLEISRDYMHGKGITIGNEPGGIVSKPVQDGVNAIFSSPDMPFRWSFMVDAKTVTAAHENDAEVLAAAEAMASWYGGMTSLAQRQAKMFADGAIYSQLIDRKSVV